MEEKGERHPRSTLKRCICLASFLNPSRPRRRPSSSAVFRVPRPEYRRLLASPFSILAEPDDSETSPNLSILLVPRDRLSEWLQAQSGKNSPDGTGSISRKPLREGSAFASEKPAGGSTNGGRGLGATRSG
jgi:hypothetical protein